VRSVHFIRGNALPYAPCDAAGKLVRQEIATAVSHAWMTTSLIASGALGGGSAGGASVGVAESTDGVAVAAGSSVVPTPDSWEDLERGTV
jgi:hypothetical protein